MDNSKVRLKIYILLRDEKSLLLCITQCLKNHNNSLILQHCERSELRLRFNTSDASQYFSILLLYNHTFLVIFQSLCLSCFLQRKNALFSSGFDGWNMTNDKFRSSNVTYIVRVELSNKKFKENRIRRHFKRFWLPGAVWVERSVRDQNIYNRCVCSSSAAEYNF